MPTTFLVAWCLAPATFLMAFAGGTFAEDAPPLKVMTFNIRYDAGEKSDAPNAWNSTGDVHRRDLALRVLDDTNADIIGMQEVLPNQRKDLEEHLEGYATYGVGRDDGKERGEQCLIFARKERFEVKDSGTFWLCDTPDKAGSKHPDAACVRIASWMKLADRQADGRELWVVNSHWDHISKAAREQAADVIRQQLTEKVKGAPLVLMGDFNAFEDTVEITGLLAADEMVRLTDAYRKVHPQRTDEEASFQGFTTRTRGSRIDYIMTSPHFEPTMAKIVTTSYEGRVPSDHYPVLVEFQWTTSINK